MRIGRLLAPVHSLGPGERVCLWTQGCKKGCVGCISPELQDERGTDIDEAELFKIVRQVAGTSSCTGLTVSGGDPFEQADALLAFLKPARNFFEDILVYTGYKLEEILGGDAGEAGKKCLSYVDVLIDGRYIKSLNTPDCVLRGSCNQTIHFLNGSEEKRKRYSEYMKRGRIVESFVHGDTTIITGILNEVTGDE